MTVEPKLKIVCQGNRATVSVIGPASVPQAVILKRFYLNALLEGIDEFTVECRQCTAMDSTFMGVLLGLALKLQRVNGRFSTQNVSLGVLKQMAGLGLSKFLSGQTKHGPGRS